GRILVDGIDVRDWDPRALRGKIAVVLQDVFLFSGPVETNITLGRRDISRAAVEAAAAHVNADGFIRRMGGYDALLRERGSNLSGGQRQLLAFARALAHDPTILVLDEATSSVDPATEWLVQGALTELLARPDLDPTLRERLELVRAVRTFAAGPLGLRVGQNYATFAELDRDATAYVLSAAHRDRLAPYTWWYPIVGRVPYQGFFDRAAADAAGRRLAARDFDVDVRPAVAFSTLGWFADPLLSTVAQAPPVELADTLIHELFHSTVYVSGDAAFNESAATFAGHRGAIAFFCSGPGRATRSRGSARRLACRRERR